MRRKALWLLSALFLVPALWAFDDKDKDKPPDKAATPAEEFQKLVREQDKAREEQQRLAREMQKFPARLMELAAKYPKDPVAVDALVRVVTSAGFTPDAQKAIAILLKDHADSNKLGQIIPFIRTPGPELEKTLRAILEKSPHREVKGPAAFALAQQLKTQSEARNAKEPQKLSDEAEKLFAEVVEKYGDVANARGGTLADAAKTDLYELRHLGIGKTIPEIDGEDVDSKAFKLSDYRGKVVLLDFWGHW